MKVLVKGDWSQAHTIFPQDSVFDDIGKNPPYDAAFLGHCLQMLNLSEVVPYLKEVADLLGELAEVWVTVPSLEWAAREIVTKDEPSVVIPLALYGPTSDPHRCGFTLMWLRVAMEGAGFTTRKAVQEAYQLNIDGIGEYMAVQNSVIGMKRNVESS
jgi:hypothetical protein